MRRDQLTVLQGGGEEVACELCARGLFLGQGGDDEATKEAMRAYADMARQQNRIRVCAPHREDLAGLGVTLHKMLAEAGRTRQQRLAMASLAKRAHRKAVAEAAARIAPAPVPEPPDGEGGGGIEF